MGTVCVDDLELELRLARLEDLMDRRPLLLNSVLLRQNPHNVHEWHKRVQLYEGKPREVGSRGLMLSDLNVLANNGEEGSICFKLSYKIG